MDTGYAAVVVSARSLTDMAKITRVNDLYSNGANLILLVEDHKDNPARNLPMSIEWITTITNTGRLNDAYFHGHALDVLTEVSNFTLVGAVCRGEDFIDFYGKVWTVL